MNVDKLPSCLFILVLNFFIFVLIIGFQAPIALKNNQDPSSGDLILLFSIILVFEAILFATFAVKETN